MNKNFSEYFDFYLKNLKPSKIVKSNLDSALELIIETKNSNKKVIIIGNGGSAAMASHVSVDLTKNSNVRSINFNEADLITCFANDFGHNNWMKEAIKHYYDEGDLTILVSSSGKSPNILNAAKFCITKKIPLITFSGMNKDNPLHQLNKSGINFWVNSKSYNHIEMIHHIWLLYIVDQLIELNSK